MQGSRGIPCSRTLLPFLLSPTLQARLFISRVSSGAFFIALLSTAKAVFGHELIPLAKVDQRLENPGHMRRILLYHGPGPADMHHVGSDRSPDAADERSTGPCPTRWQAYAQRRCGLAR